MTISRSRRSEGKKGFEENLKGWCYLIVGVNAEMGEVGRTIRGGGGGKKVVKTQLRSKIGSSA